MRHFYKYILDQHDGCRTCLSVLQSLENIDDDCARHEIKLIKTTEEEFALEVGINEFPGLVFFHNGVPNIYEGKICPVIN